MKFLKVKVPVSILPLIVVLFMAFSPVESYSQSAENSGPQSLTEQFQELKDKSNNYNEYKVVKAYKLNEFWKHVGDTLNMYKSDLRLARNEIDLLKGEIESLKADIN